MKRRSLLLAGAFSGLAAATSSCSSEWEGPKSSAFSNRLRIPPLAEPEPAADGAKQFSLDLLAGGRAEILPGLTTRTWGINGPYLGPTVRVNRGDRVRMAVTNRLGEVTTLHWHGMRLPARMDGGPHQTIEPGATWRPEWTIEQPAATTWFHPHLHGTTAMHVYRGLAGLLLIDDPDGPALPSTYGVDDLPLIIQDKRFGADGALNTGDVDGGTFGFLGNRILVNGTFGPFLEVRSELVRFRLLNASNARVYRVGFADGRRFQVIATDAGLLERPVTVERVKISPGERVEIVVRFTAGEEAVLDSRGEDPKRANDIEEEDFTLLKLVAAGALAESAPLPDELGGVPAEPPPTGARRRRFVLTGSEINGNDMDMTRIDEVVPAGAHEIWELDNTTYAHNFHIHEAPFRILDINGTPPPAYQRGPKDTVFIPKNAKVRLAATFGTHIDPLSPYMYHCHILRHEDKGMVGQFVVVRPGTENQVSRKLPQGHHQH
ncbi:multicopper oxidase family protein [Actinoplanes regularis]|uniref:multicopper oxidase family protein n=1 Tax=Actinoplanes regularis TaxID=52697 RepID=UPI0024A0082C|nr:multicopper oxidase domain-containing protein [Actinoplanes regularis]GLW34660.1 multicopper oxidase [Actinoplanes regularis]